MTTAITWAIGCDCSTPRDPEEVIRRMGRMGRMGRMNAIVPLSHMIPMIPMRLIPARCAAVGKGKRWLLAQR